MFSVLFGIAFASHTYIINYGRSFAFYLWVDLSLNPYTLRRVSELRIVELLDDLCDKMQDYTLQKVKK
jgi:hypothetical protein